MRASTFPYITGDWSSVQVTYGSCALCEDENCGACVIANDFYTITTPWRDGEVDEQSFMEGGFLQALETPLPCYAYSYVEVPKIMEERGESDTLYTLLNQFTMASIFLKLFVDVWVYCC